MSLLNVEKLAGGYERLQILWGIDLKVNEGETVLLLGANGSGKTTLLRTLIGLLPSWEGRIEFAGEAIQALRPDQRIRRGLGFMSERGVFPDLSIEENLRLGGYYLPAREVRKRTAELYEMFPDLAKKRRQAASSLSGGQRKMLGMAKLLVSRPRLLLLDEPSSGLAPVFVKQVIATLKTLEASGASLLIAEQNVAFMGLADRAYLLEGGRVAVSGTPQALERNDAVRAVYFGL